jgi:hypothetical protein
MTKERAMFMKVFFDAGGLQPFQGDEKRLRSSNRFSEKVALSFVIPSAAEGSAVLRTFPGNVFDYDLLTKKRIAFLR